MNSTNQTYITMIILAVICNTASGIKCYNCSSHTDSECINVTPDSSFLHECEKTEAFCRKTVQTITTDDLTIITRSCGWIKFEEHPDEYCMLSNTNFKKETSCQCFTDACNAGVALHNLITFRTLFLPIILSVITLSGC